MIIDFKNIEESVMPQFKGGEGDTRSRIFFDGLNITFSNAIRGAGDTRFPMWVMTLSSIFVFALPCVILFSLGMPWWSLWLTLLVDVPLLATVFTVRYLGGKWTRMRVIDVPPAPEAAEA